ncbi:MAG: hypothetical protein SFX73_31475 [Kofleriaceae bacterium]|nr:hypothetical protein [Kofleriaceae bacterium]
MAKVRALIVPFLVALAWGIPAAWIAKRAWSARPAGGEVRELRIPLAPDTFRHVGATHVGAIAGPGVVWAGVLERTGFLKRAVRIQEVMTRFPGQEATFYPRVARIDFLTTHAGRWYNTYGYVPPEDVAAAIELGPDENGTFVARMDGHEVRVQGNPTFPTQVPPGVLAEALPAPLREQLATWCVISGDLSRVSRGHQTFQTLVATRLTNVVSALCCMSDHRACPAPPGR